MGIGRRNRSRSTSVATIGPLTLALSLEGRGGILGTAYLTAPRNDVLVHPARAQVHWLPLEQCARRIGLGAVVAMQIRRPRWVGHVRPLVFIKSRREFEAFLLDIQYQPFVLSIER